VSVDLPGIESVCLAGHQDTGTGHTVFIMNVFGYEPMLQERGGGLLEESLCALPKSLQF
jgi:hypothetical protein